ncbi:MAG: site-specific DNA-methyltransferase [Myxococcota bacterium]|nr:site-specific DNA-methyltransferase [Myxococcota bacterium]
MPHEPTGLELVWPGKYDDQGERFRAPESALSWHELERRGSVEQPPNLLCHADNLAGMQALLPSHRGRFALIYIDPPFATGHDFVSALPLGSARVKHDAPRLALRPAYQDPGKGELCAYIEALAQRLMLIRELLSDTGTLYVHCDTRLSSYLRLLLDEIFGAEQLRNTIAWCYRGGGTPRRDFAAKHDTIFRYSKSKHYTFNLDAVRQPYAESVQQSQPSRYRKSYRRSGVYDGYEPNPLGKHPEDWWPIQPLMPSDKRERVGYPTQKPLALLRRIVLASSAPGDWVGDFFAGSGTTLVAAALEGRRWVGMDCGALALHCTRKRLVSLENPPSFERWSSAPLERISLPPSRLAAGAQLEQRIDGLPFSLRFERDAQGRVAVQLLPAERANALKGSTQAELFGTKVDLDLDAWAADWDDEGPFCADWESHRDNTAGVLATRSGPSPHTLGAALRLRLFDVHARELELYQPLLP